ncbi:MAG: helix-turn-helix transcriptional regulator [Paracoccaceae bacterium]|nr:MAG: helix-turn-helix transcriptional regulator [Paracoccaceae bacterium]
MTDTEQGWFSDEAATFGDRMAGAREAAGLSQEDLARRLGVRLTTVQAWEDDRADPRANRLQMAAGMLGVSIRWLLTGEGDGLDRPPAQTVLAAEAQEVLTDLARLRNALVVLSADVGRAEKRLRVLLREDAA